jgi:hypothetical protein
MWSIKSLAFYFPSVNYFQSVHTYPKSILAMHCVFNFYLHLSKRTFTLINIQQVAPEMNIETCGGFQVKCPLLLPDVNQNWNVLTNFSEISKINLIKICSAILNLLDAER